MDTISDAFIAHDHLVPVVRDARRTTGRPRVTVHRWRSEAAVTLTCASLQTTWLPDVGMLGVSLQHDGRELLALPGGLAAYRSGHVTGLPLLAPWANRLGQHSYRVADTAVDLEGVSLPVDDVGLPIHGTMMAQSGWEVVGANTDGEAAWLHVHFDFARRPDLLESFPFPHELEVEIRLSDSELKLATTLRPVGTRAVPISFGYHPYFRLPEAPRRDWRLGLPARQHRDLDQSGLPTGAGHDEPAERKVIGSRTFDDLYALGPDRVFTLESGSEHLAVAFDDGYRYAQVYAPPRRNFICIEPMTAPTNALVREECPSVVPGESFRAEFAISVAPRA